MPERDVLLRLAAALGALAAGAVAVTVVVLLAHRTPGPVSAATPALPSAGTTTTSRGGSIATSVAGFPAPPPNAIVFAREDGSDALALALVPHGSQLQLQTSVVDRQGAGVTGLRVAYSVHRGDALARAVGKPCGAGCYSASVSLPSRPTRVDVAVAGKHATTIWRVALPDEWPPPDATRLLAQAERTWRSLETLVFHERLGSDPQHVVRTVWQVVAPDKLRYDVEGGSSAVIIGDRRWDKLPGQAWQRSSALPVHQPVPFWAQVTDAHILGTTTYRGHTVRRVTFFDPKTPAWFEVLIDAQTARTLDLRMTTTAHFMHESFEQFDGPVAIRPPACRDC